MNILYEELLKYIPAKRKLLPSGFITFKCPMCKDHSPRSGMKLDAHNSIIVNCFNCGFSTVWSEGNVLHKKMKEYMKNLGVPPEEIRRINFLLWQRSEPNKTPTEYQPKYKVNFEIKELPVGAMSFEYWKNLENPPGKFNEVLNYVRHRKMDSYYEYYWSEKTNFKNRVIIPFYYDNQIVGWTARTITNENPKYYANSPNGYLFNNSVLFKSERKYIIIVEGAFDAIAIDGIGALGNQLSDTQINWINSIGKEVIVVPDKDKSGRQLIELALANKWSVSSPKGCPKESTPAWRQNIKDVADAVKEYGRLYALRSIIENKISNELEIKLKTKGF